LSSGIGGEPGQLAGIFSVILGTGLVSHFIFRQNTKKSEKATEDLEKLKSSALNLEASTEVSLFDEDRFSHLVKSIFKTQKELNDILSLSKNAINADSAIFFTIEGDNFIPKASTEKTDSAPINAGKGYLLGVINEKKAFVQPKLDGSLFSSGYSDSNEIKSSLCVPVLDSSIPIGVLAIESKKLEAFGEREKEVAVGLASQITRIIRRNRYYTEIERFAMGFKSLHEASKTLSTSLRVEDIADRFVDLVAGMVNASAVGFFFADKGKLRVIAKRGFEPEKESFYPKGTFFDLIIKNKHSIHVSRVDKKQGVYPFKMDTKTFLGIPIIYEKDVIGVFAVTSTEAEAISSFQEHLLNTVADQAAMSITNAQLHREVGRLAITDGLTGLYNHKHFQERLSEEFQRVERIPHSLSLMLIDIDHFKKINDSYGHPTGDAVLAKLAATLRKTLRGIDVLARYGGEEFAAVLINTETNGAKKMGERLRTHIMNNPFYVDEYKLSITISVGIATHPKDAATKEELIDKADQVLYHAKKNGRNQVCTWKDDSKKIN
jgi:diguanylate cyclase (GGDEF)-like protein